MFSVFVRYIKYLLLACVIAVVVVFSAKNSHDLQLSLFPLPYEMQMPTFLLVIVSFLIGYSVSLWHSYRLIRRLKREARQSRVREEALRNEVESLKAEQPPLPSSLAA